MSRTGESRCVHPLDEKIEEEKKDAEKEQEDEGRINVTAGEAAERADKLRWNSSEARLFAPAVEWANNRVAGKAAAKGAELVVGPNGKVVASAPNESGADRENDVTDHS
ncbi:MAG: hypothetical protein WBE12_14165 [Candidatus Acidiferrum sp.]